MTFGVRVRELCEETNWTQRDLAERLGMGVSNISKVENECAHFGDYPSAKFLSHFAEMLNADEDKLLLLADKIPRAIKERLRQRPEAFRNFAALNDQEMDRFLQFASSKVR
jgi:transcriptional regulator with XRE-family HTH domain